MHTQRSGAVATAAESGAPLLKMAELSRHKSRAESLRAVGGPAQELSPRRRAVKLGLRVAIVLQASVLLQPAQAQFHTGNTFLPMLKLAAKGPAVNYGADFVSANFATGYVAGVADANFDKHFCHPPSVTIGQVVAIAHKFLISEPAIRHRSAKLMIEVSLNQAFPCPRK